jgi:Ca2+/Na+ antiporter
MIHQQAYFWFSFRSFFLLTLLLLLFRIASRISWWQLEGVMMVFMYWSVVKLLLYLSLINLPFKASYELRHARHGHVHYSIISLLNKKEQLHLTSLLPNPTLCSTSQLAKSHQLPFTTTTNQFSTKKKLLLISLIIFWALFTVIYGTALEI